MTAVKDKPAVLPTVDELIAARAALQAAVRGTGDVYFPVHRLALTVDEEVDERDPVPTLEDIGRLFAFVDHAEGYLREATDYVQGIRDALADLGEIREKHGLDPFDNAPACERRWTP